MTRARILLLSANPDSTARLALDEEVRAIQVRLRQSGAAERIELCAEWALRADELPAALMRHRPRVIHFSGHGSSAGELYLSSGKSGDISPVAAETLRRIFEPLAKDISCVVLNACYSAKQAETLAQILPCVVGMSKAVKDTAAIAFAGGFYEALAFGESLETAFKLGCAQIELAQGGEQREIPKLLLRPGTNPATLHPFATSPSRPPRPSWIPIAATVTPLLLPGVAGLIWWRLERGSSKTLTMAVSPQQNAAVSPLAVQGEPHTPVVTAAGAASTTPSEEHNVPASPGKDGGTRNGLNKSASHAKAGRRQETQTPPELVPTKIAPTPGLADSLANVATLQEAQGDYRQSLETWLKVLEIRKKLFGSDHPIFAETIQAVAKLHIHLGSFNDALTLQRQALIIYERSLGSEHPLVASALNQLAGTLIKLTRYGEAAPLVQRALVMRRKTLGPSHPDEIPILENLALLYEKSGNVEKRDSTRKEIDLLKKKLGVATVKQKNLAMEEINNPISSKQYVVINVITELDDKIYIEGNGFKSDLIATNPREKKLPDGQPIPDGNQAAIELTLSPGFYSLYCESSNGRIRKHAIQVVNGKGVYNEKCNSD